MNPDNAEASGILPRDPRLSPLEAHLGPAPAEDPLPAIHQMLQNLHQRMTVVEERTATAQALLQTALTAAQANATPPAPPPPMRLSLLKITLQTYSGRCNENLQAWLGMAEDCLQDSNYPRDRWTVAVAPMFKDAALTWYYATKTENNNQAPHWDDLKQKLLNHFEPPARQNEMRSLLDKITFHGDMDLYVRLFQGVEIQIPVASMTLDDRKYRFMDGLPQDLSMQLFRQQDNSMATVYTTARHWASL